ncbi:hypothetical protein ES288_D05G169400v1 [Gossypium darwinii]|uniref:FLZ-type domain-containing protein n=1 Tax=Gossypium darwinii TaxID=34276 RepID=A0A5D2CKE9_GOSDA|nr:hypothetical protein ES288_D05G169400v1 [Gossypium darwinii]
MWKFQDNKTQGAASAIANITGQYLHWQAATYTGIPTPTTNSNALVQCALCQRRFARNTYNYFPGFCLQLLKGKCLIHRRSEENTSVYSQVFTDLYTQPHDEFGTL